jgi:hypothetical protein
MQRLTAFSLILSLTLVFDATVPEAQGQSLNPTVSRLNAVSCEPLPAPLQTEVIILDDTDQIIAFRKLFEEKLLAKGVAISKTAPTIATLDIKIEREIPVAPRGDPSDLGRSEENRGIGREATGSGQGNVWSTKDTSLFGGPKEQSNRLSLNQLQISVDINRRDDGRCLWQGKVLHDFHGDEDANALTAKILPVLAQSLGKTISDRKLIIDP